MIIMPPVGGGTGWRNAELTIALGTWAHQDGIGVVFDSSAGFLLPNGAMRSPDAAWVRRVRLEKLTPEQKRKFIPLCPDFVVVVGERRKIKWGWSEIEHRGQRLVERAGLLVRVVQAFNDDRTCGNCAGNGVVSGVVRNDDHLINLACDGRNRRGNAVALVMGWDESDDQGESFL